MSQQFSINKVGIIGSGIMGSQLAALMAGAGVDVELLDIVDPGDSIARLKGIKPRPFFAKGDLRRIRTGVIEADIERLKGCDWIIEAIVEDVQKKRDLYLNLMKVIDDDAVITSNTSSILLKDLTLSMRTDFCRRFFVTHFFNPPRYMKLVEVVAGDATKGSAINRVASFLEEKLGKGIVRTKDTPAFIANRIGVFHAFDVLHMTAKNKWPIEAVDIVLGKASAKPKSGIFGTIDMVGLDIFFQVALMLSKNCEGDGYVYQFQMPQYVQRMMANGWVGRKSNRGFYYKDERTGRKFSLDVDSVDYRRSVSFRTESLDEASRLADPGERLRRVVFAKDQSSEIAWPAISRMLCYAAYVAPQIADDIVSIDRALKWGYNWELGPFEMWDALGVERVVERLDKEGTAMPELVSDLIESGKKGFYESARTHRKYFDFAKRKYVPLKSTRDIDFTVAIAKGNVVERNSSASIIDIGDGVFACRFRTKMNIIDDDVMQILRLAIVKVGGMGRALLIANGGEHFSVGANLVHILGLAKARRWNDIDTMIVKFQQLNQRIRLSKMPVVAVPFGMTLGGGAELCLASARCVASMESYIGLTEMSVGLIPAGGGCKNLLLALEGKSSGGPQPKISRAFDTIAMSRVSNSAREAIEFGLLSKTDSICMMDRGRLIERAKEEAVLLSENYIRATERDDILLSGRGGEMALINAAGDFVRKGVATEYDLHVARKLAHVLSGGDVPTIHMTDEQHILDLEREAFLSLAGEESTHKRIEHTLKTGKPLRN